MKTILQVEDDPNDAFLMKRALKKAGIADLLRVATNGQEAMDYLQGAGKFANRLEFPLPFLVLLDLKLPRVMGLEVLCWIRQQSGRPLVVIILSASADGNDIATAYSLGANAFLTKPAQIEQLEQMAVAIRDFWLIHNTPPQLPREGLCDLVRSSPGQLRLGPWEGSADFASRGI